MARTPRTQAAAPDPAPDASTAPARVRLLRPYGFYDTDGRHRHWHQGVVASYPDDIALLLERGAPVSAED